MKVTVDRAHVEKAITEMTRYANAYEEYLNAGVFQELSTFLEFAAEVEQIKNVIAGLSEVL